ncbi:periplasmic heavy metal sensor [Xinfangfangia sp. CPCC 101601]|uniref:Periplasmic heavy metal sensor n=1 Tax=Pseudogemmobacter lacusdianii TaxID=3069608 RepID=A0ABU0VVD6_9RHOB|nr:periplasmic heavy metal sensor [Xinfangfangia sp. CPCC 101601]MDQ2065669.1 periplasmic heavy metal sensor [Xinfangfangia sp. CPCC 101601]
MSAVDMDSKPKLGLRGLRIALAISLALNVAVAGVVGGVMLRDGPPQRGSRDFGLGPLSEVLDREDRRALRKAFVAQHSEFRDQRHEAQAEFAAVVQALRAEPFDANALDAALAAVASRNQRLIDSGRLLVAGHLAQMSATERAAFADRLEERLQHGRKAQPSKS